MIPYIIVPDRSADWPRRNQQSQLPEKRAEVRHAARQNKPSALRFCAAGLKGRVIQSGDKIYLTQYQETGSKGGLILSFTDGSSTNWTAKDQDGYWLNDDQKPARKQTRQDIKLFVAQGHYRVHLRRAA